MKTIQINSISSQIAKIQTKYESMDFLELSKIANKKHDLPEFEKAVFEKIFAVRSAFFHAQMWLFKVAPAVLVQECGSESFLKIAEVYGLSPIDMVINHD